ncbi:MAG: hypothetical protein EPN17_07865 [Methylobacter sp.]|nr:MAG: hypothetical protein EPN17_07865 [Methylobacter sp.]
MKKINFTKSEYRILLDLIYVTDWILHSHDSEDRSDTQEYSNLFQKLMSYAKDMDCDDLIDFDKHLKKYSESFIFEAESPALAYIEKFEDDSFWDELISRLAQRDALTDQKVNNMHTIETEELFAAISKAEDKWSNEFERFGLSRIRLNKTQSDTVH